MKNAVPDFNNSMSNPSMYNTIWSLIIFGTRGDYKYQGFDPKDALTTATCSKIFHKLVHSADREDYWKWNLDKTFKASYDSEYMKTIDIPSKVWFFKYSHAAYQILLNQNLMITHVATYCMEILSSKDKLSDKKSVYALLSPHIPLLSLPHSNKEAQYCLGICFMDGLGVLANLPEGFKYVKLSADQGLAKAQHLISILYERGLGTAPDPTQTFNYAKLSADQGHSRAQFYIGLRHRENRNFEEAFNYFKKSADQEYAPAQNQLGICYAKGFGVEKNEIESLKFFTLSANQGFAAAQCYLGLFYSTTNPSKSFKYLKLSADQSFAQAQCELAFFYFFGRGTSQNTEEAVKYLKLSADQSYVSAQYGLANYYLDIKNLPEAFRYMKLAADTGYAKAQEKVSRFYKNGIGVQENLEEAKRYLKLATDQHAAALNL